MQKALKKRQEGFTIIEVMIVLVIAAVILLIVFLAVPALQRNSRNTQRKNEAAQLLSAASEFSSNSNGQIPNNTNSAAILALTKNRNITTLNIQTAAGTAGAAVTVTPAATLTSATLVTNAACSGSGVVVGTSTRQIALAYQVENGSGSGTAACVDSGL